MKISVAMIVRDEEENLRRCLDSVQSFADEIVIVDTGSIDKTVEIAREYTDKIFFHKWNNDFSEARNVSISHATGDWLFLIDADEEVDQEAQEQIHEFLEQIPDDVNTVTMTVVNYVDPEHRVFDMVQNTRMFRNGTVHYVNKIHNQPVYKEKVFYFNGKLYHYGYIWTPELREKKYQRTATLLKEQLKEDMTPKLRHYYQLQLYKTELIGNRIADSYELGKTIFEDLKNETSENIPGIAYEYWVLFGFQSIDNDDYDTALQCFTNALEAEPKCTDGYLGMAMYDLRVGNTASGIENVKKFFKLYPTMIKNIKDYSFTVTSPKYLDIMNIIASMLYAKMGQTKKAIDYINKVNFDGLLKTELKSFIHYYLKTLTKEIPEKSAGRILEVLEPYTEGLNISPLEYRLQKSKFQYNTKRKKIAIICGAGGDMFIRPIFVELNKKHVCRLLIPQSKEDIKRIMAWADIVWLEWANDLSAACSNEEKHEGQKYIVRAHSYEILTGLIGHVNWKNIDKAIFVADHALETARRMVEIPDAVIIHNGLQNAEKFIPKQRGDGFNIAFDGNLNFKKNPELLLQIMNKLVNIDTRYKFYWAGSYDDVRTMLYMEHMIAEMGLQDNFQFEPWQDDVNAWLEDKDYYISPSILETYGMSIVEAMAKGIKPVIHNFYGAKEYYPEEYLFNTVDEAVEMITNDEYNSEAYIEFAKTKSFAKQVQQINDVIDNL